MKNICSVKDSKGNPSKPGFYPGVIKDSVAVIVTYYFKPFPSHVNFLWLSKDKTNNRWFKLPGKT